MKIGELAGRTGLTPSRIRFYERIGLLKTVRRQANGYRTYPPEAVDMLMLITTAQQAGFSLQELRALLPADLTSWDHGALLEALHQKVREIEAIQERLAASKARLLRVLSEVQARPEDMDCASNARRVLSRFGLGGPDPAASRSPPCSFGVP